MTTQARIILDLQNTIDRSGYYFASCEGNGVIHAIPRGTSDCANGYREGFRVRVGVRGGLSLWLDRYGAEGEADAAKGKDARRCLAINLQ